MLINFIKKKFMSSVKNSNGVSLSMGVCSSKGVHLSDGVSSSKGVHLSRGVRSSEGVCSSKGVHLSDGVSSSKGVHLSDGVSSSEGVNSSNGVSLSEGVCSSFGVFNSYGVDKHIFCANKERVFTIFKTTVSEERFYEVMCKINENLDGWFPKFNNAFELYLENGSEWKKVNASEITGTLEDDKKPYEAWKDMPKEAIDYIKALSEFDAEIFKTVTGIDVNENPCCHKNCEYKFCPNCGCKI